MTSRLRIPLLENVTANSNGATKPWYSYGLGTLHVFGTWDTATVTIEGSTDEGVTWTPVTGGVFTEDKITSFEAGEIEVRAVVSSVGASTDLTAYLIPQTLTF